MRLFLNLVRAALHLAVAAVFGYYNFRYYDRQEAPTGYLAAATNFCFLLLGMSLVATWARREKRPCGQTFVRPCSPATCSGANSAAAADETVKAATAGVGSTPLP